MIRILHIMGCADAGGISTVVRNYYQFMDRSKFHFDIALTVPGEGQNSRALGDMGCQVYHIPMKGEDRQGFCRELTRLLKEGHYDGVHVHESETSYVALRLAKKLGIPCRIAHAHTTSPYEGVRSVIRRLSGCMLNYPYASRVIGCGQLAGERIYGRLHMKGKRAAVLPNAVDLKRFSYDPEVRREMRRELCVEDRYVIGMVARLHEQKNIPFALELMRRLREKEPKAVLLIAGNGEDEQKILTRIHEMKLEDTVKLLGRRSDVDRLYQAFDLFLLPSLYEGYPVSAVEALATGLPVLLSTKITPELSRFQGVTYLSLKDPEAWIRKLLEYRQDPQRGLRQDDPRKAGLDIRDTAKLLEKIYEEDTGKREP